MADARIPDTLAVTNAVVAALREVLAGRAASVPEPLDGGTRLLGRGAVLDSLGLVTLIVDLEERLEREFDATVSLANERAMSQTRSPFLSVASLTEYIHAQLLEAGGNGGS